MTKRIRKNYPADVLRELRRRSKNKCECCGLDITVDKHHIWEFAKDGPDTTSNLLCLCPSCHRALPKLLSEEDQQFFQTLSFEKRSISFSFYSKECEFEIGNVLYKNVKYILLLDGKPAIYPYQINQRFYVNIVMLDDFDPFLLVIANKVVCKSEHITISSEADRLKIMDRDNLILEIERSNDRIKTKTNFKYKGKNFIFNDDGSFFPGNMGISNLSIIGADDSKTAAASKLAAVSWNSPSTSDAALRSLSLLVNPHRQLRKNPQVH